MKGLTRGRVAGVTALVVLGALATVAIISRPSPVHADGAGPLASAARQMHESMSVDPKRSGATAWTFGLRLCMAQGEGPAILRRVDPQTALGTGFRQLGVGLRTFTPTPDHEPIVSVPGYPPPSAQVPDKLRPVEGHAVTTPCSNGPTQEYTELLVGLGMVGDDGGGWKGVSVSYDVGGRAFTLLIDHDLLICGRSDPVC